MSSNNPQHSSVPRRRSSLASPTTLAERLGRPPPTDNSNGSLPGPIVTAAANASASHRRRSSLATLALTTSPTATSPFGTAPGRSPITNNLSPASTSNALHEESAVEDGDSPPSATRSSHVARRVSFGAKALHDIKAGYTAATEPIFWSEQIKSRAERSASATQRPVTIAPSAVTEQPKATSLPMGNQTLAKSCHSSNKPDHFQERILKGDFFMD